MEKLLKEAGAERVGEDAKAALRDLLEEESLRIGKRAAELAIHADRKTVRADDVRLARKHG
jgi:histone H3/H4